VIRNAGGVVTDDRSAPSRSPSTRSAPRRSSSSTTRAAHADVQRRTSGSSCWKTGVEPEWAAEAFRDLDEDVRRIDRPHHIQPIHPQQGIARGFVYDVTDGSARGR
jgi:carbonic anhydrase